ncbi:MAG: putative quinol monooxygenase [Sphingomonas sp.]
MCISERWRTRTAQSAPLTGNHRVAFDIDARAANVVATKIESYDNGMVRRLLQIPATNLCAERKAKAMVIVMSRAKLGPGEIDGLRADMEAQIRATRAGDGCSALRFSRDVLDPDMRHIAERWRDQASIDAYFATPHMATFNRVLAIGCWQ